MQRSQLLFNLLYILFITFLTSCSFLPSKLELSDYVQISSNPEGATVVSSSGMILGQTPLKLDNKLIARIQKDKILSFSLKKLNYQEKRIILKYTGVFNIKIELEKVTFEQFKTLASGEMSEYINDMAKKLINIQENILTKRFKQASEDISELKKIYPNVASLYTLNAAIEIQQKNYQQAQNLVERALLLDKSNDLAKSYLNYLQQQAKE